VINEWHAASGQTYSTSVTLPAGQNYLQVEFFENTGEAHLDFTFTQIGGGAPPPQPAPGGVLATVTAYRLNVRNAPNPVTGLIILRINRLETYPVVGRTADSTWYLLNVGGTNGWASGAFLNVPLGANIPVAPAPTGITATGNSVTATPFNVVIRSGPGTQFRRIGLFPVGGVAPIIGRNGNTTWWQINFNGLVGWPGHRVITVHRGGSGAKGKLRLHRFASAPTMRDERLLKQL
jgi:uncharacterized protein YraI